MSFEQQKKGSVVYMTAATISSRHAFTTRFGGVSEGIYASMNLGTGRGDEDELIRENYRLLGEATGINTFRMAFTKQVHKADVRIVDEGDIHTLFTAVPYEADGRVTSQKGLALICFTADCVPVLLEDPVKGVIGAIHCGWRSSVGDILGNALAAMESLGAKAENICAGIGPAISGCCFQVGAEVIEAAKEYIGSDIDGLYRPDENAEGK
ncbi:MAG: laccase domain-containing protein, partial [Oscillospiraceae bacterium]|nr:laccase domain-containing protein [Oscillospiraceae bacterium]